MGKVGGYWEYMEFLLEIKAVKEDWRICSKAGLQIKSKSSLANGAMQRGRAFGKKIVYWPSM